MAESKCQPGLVSCLRILYAVSCPQEVVSCEPGVLPTPTMVTGYPKSQNQVSLASLGPTPMPEPRAAVRPMEAADWPLGSCGTSGLQTEIREVGRLGGGGGGN